MNNQNGHTSRDLRVSETYRKIADESTPDHLNEAVMRMAVQASRTRYAAARAWLRPAAWAALICLCLALVLDLTQLPQEALLHDGAPAKSVTNEANRPKLAPSREVPESRKSQQRVSGKAMLMESEWRAEKIPAKSTAAPGMRGDEFADDRDFLCPSDIRSSADRWYDCINALRDTTPARRITAELEALFAAYPDFAVPAGQ